jgi:large subunit ribosomal protein L30
MLRIKLVKSPIGNNKRNRATVQALGLRNVQQVVEHADNPSIRGMIHHVKHMLLVEEVADSKPVAEAAIVGETDAAPNAARTPRATEEADAE